MNRRADTPTRFDLYRWCVQDPPRTARFLDAVHGHNPRTLREDFSGPAGLCSEWVTRSPKHRAVAVDRDPEPLRHAERHTRIALRCADARRATDKADVLALFNFAVCELHDRTTLLAYFKHLRRCLNPRGIVALDLYGGMHAFTTGTTATHARTPDGKKITYTWEQRAADPATGMVENAIHFRLGSRTWRDAFVYRWRLWSIAEVREAFTEAGFRSTEVHDRLGDAIDAGGRLRVRAVTPGEPLDDDYVVYLIARR